MSPQNSYLTLMIIVPLGLISLRIASIIRSSSRAEREALKSKPKGVLSRGRRLEYRSAFLSAVLPLLLVILASAPTVLILYRSGVRSYLGFLLLVPLLIGSFLTAVSIIHMKRGFKPIEA